MKQKDQVRKKFIRYTMTAFALVLLFTIAAITAINYVSVLREADAVTNALSGDASRSGKLRKRSRMNDRISAETPYESRYFIVTMNASDGTVLNTDVRHIASVDTEEAVNYAADVYGKSARGTVRHFRYLQTTNGETTRVVFLDFSRSLYDLFRFFTASLVISLICFFVVFFLISFFSGRIIRPVTESYEKQKRFITDASHEIRTPLAIIRADADAAEGEKGESEWLDDIKTQTDHLTRLMEDMVFLARMEETAGSAQTEVFSLTNAAKEQAASFYALCMEQEKTLTTEIADGMELKGNETMIRRLLSILLDNALKYSPAQSEILLRVSPDGKGVLLRVRNVPAVPVDPEALPHIFERFYRPDASRNSESGGFGIGLSVAKEIVEAHHGTIAARSEDGTSFEIVARLFSDKK